VTCALVHRPRRTGSPKGKPRSGERFSIAGAVALACSLFCPALASGQTKAPASTAETAARATENVKALQAQVAELSALVERLNARVDELEKLTRAKAGSNPVQAGQGGAPSAASLADPSPSQNAPAAAAGGADERGGRLRALLDGTTLNFTLDGYYAYNFNRPYNRVNLLRAYDVSSNSFSLNQAALILERAPDVAQGQRFGARLDLQFGQATETLQGSAANELRPQVYRNVFQAYGTYVAPLGSGLTLDFGKWASPLGYENNYTKDQWNYSRSFLFNFLPFYHMGLRASYNLTPRVAVAYWLVNGAQQTEDFNGAKSQGFLLTLKPSNSITWNLNYYTGQEQPDVVAVLNPGFPTGSTQPGLPVTPIVPAPDGREHIVDTYAQWSATPKLSLAGEADYVVNRRFSISPPGHVTAGAAYARYQFTPKLALAGRAEYFSDRGGLFSGVTQALKETTFTADYKLAEGFLARWEWRRDFSNRPFFLTDQPDRLKKEQNTATVGLIWWWGQKQGAW
jgi:Putative beta-barrel porin-2, OmpL-like. bbp2